MLSKFTARLKEKTPLTRNICLFKFQTTDQSKLNFVAGQYLSLTLKDGEGKSVKRLYSVADPPSNSNLFGLLIEFIPNGIGSNFFLQLTVGQTVEFEGPAGVFSLKKNNNNKVFLVTGTGLAPARSIMLDEFKIKNLKLKINLYWGLPYLKDVYLFDEFKTLSRQNPGFSFRVCLSRETNLWKIPTEDQKYFFLGRIDKCFLSVFSDTQSPISSIEFYLCGGRQVVDSLRQSLSLLSAPKENIFFEKF